MNSTAVRTVGCLLSQLWKSPHMDMGLDGPGQPRVVQQRLTSTWDACQAGGGIPAGIVHDENGVTGYRAGNKYLE